MSGLLPYTDANRKVVALLYRRALKLSYSWINRRDLYRKKAVEIRQSFDANKHINDPRKLEDVINKTEALLHKYRHPDPIIPASRPGGTKFERNIPPSLEEPIPGHY